MSQPTSFIDCRGLSAPLTVLRIKQAVVGRQDCGLPLDVLVDRACTAPDRVAACLTGESTDVRLVYSSAEAPEGPVAKTRSAPQGTARHV
ncbi:hypothetical protein CKO11_11720 [Rhodobacter sp. TJ_12]|uniref:hypothetical protein n=1 Tax=Rhodobacter sp. TJ_12 TaxID=2029399 RepID=UPI001CBA6E9D|nr:hypothetical protein [Rhodobacter sp. TJ_12]MBZ4023128.1 hypothetical protein [Rhodobacter sp. TJ_12]